MSLYQRAVNEMQKIWKNEDILSNIYLGMEMVLWLRTNNVHFEGIIGNIETLLLGKFTLNDILRKTLLLLILVAVLLLFLL